MQHSRLWAAAEVQKFRVISDVMCNRADCEQQLKYRNLGWSLMWCATEQTVNSSWKSPQIQDDLWCDVQHSRLWTAGEEFHKFRMISDVMCNTADCEQQLKKSTNLERSLMWCATQQSVSNSWRSSQIRIISDVICNTVDSKQQLKKSKNSGWSLTWCETQQIVSSSWRNPQTQDDLWWDMQHSRLWAAAEEVHKLRMISDVMCNTAAGVQKFRVISDVMCNRADCEQQLKKSSNSGCDVMSNIADCEEQLKKSTNSGWTLMWCATQQLKTINSGWSLIWYATQQIVNSSWRNSGI